MQTFEEVLIYFHDFLETASYLDVVPCRWGYVRLFNEGDPMYAYEGYDITEISKVYGVSRPTISIKIKRITKFLKNFNFNAMD